MKVNALNEEWVRGTDVDVRANTGFVACGIRTVRAWQRLEDSRNALVVSCGDVQLGDRGRSNETLRALACRRFSSSLPEGALLSTAHPAVHLEMRRRDGSSNKKKKKKKKTPNAAYHSTKKIFWGSVPTLEARCSLKSAVWRRIEWVHQSANDKTTTWPPAAGSAWKSCFDQLGHDRSAVIIQWCAACPWISAVFPGGRHYFSPHKMAKKITDYRDTPALNRIVALKKRNVRI